MPLNYFLHLLRISRKIIELFCPHSPWWPRTWVRRRPLRSFKWQRGPDKDAWGPSWMKRAGTWTGCTGPRNLGQTPLNRPQSAYRRCSIINIIPCASVCPPSCSKICWIWFAGVEGLHAEEEDKDSSGRRNDFSGNGELNRPSILLVLNFKNGSTTFLQSYHCF